MKLEHLLNNLLETYNTHPISSMFEFLESKIEPDEKQVGILVKKPNVHNIWGFYISKKNDDVTFRILHSASVNKNIVNSLNGMTKAMKYWSNYKGDTSEILTELANQLDRYQLKKNQDKVNAKRTSGDLEFVWDEMCKQSTSGKVYTWKEVKAIANRSDTPLYAELSQPGIYLQRSQDGTVRYVGAAYSDGGILSRWLTHVRKLGDAKHLNEYVMDQGYSNFIFTVLEFTGDGDVLAAEKKWKDILGTVNHGEYDGIRLNKN